MRVLIFSTTYFPLVGGAEVALKETTDRIKDIRFDLICAKIKRELPSEEKIGNVMVHRVGFGNASDKYLLPILGVWKACQLGSASDLPIVWSLMASYGGFAALAYCWVRQKTKFLLSVQEGDPLEHYAERAGALNFLHREVFTRANAVHAISRFLAGWASKMGFTGTPEVIPNGVDIPKFIARIVPERRMKLRHSFGFEDSDTVIVTASRLSKKNGIDDLIRALAKLPASFKLLVAGEGEDRDALQTLTQELGVTSRVEFSGTVSRSDLPVVLQSADIFVRASLSEGLGIAFLEAMASGIPIVGTNVGGIPDFLTDGETGAFCKPSDPDSIITAITRIASDTSLRARLVTNGERLVREHYSWDGIATRIRGMLTSLSTRS